MTSGRRPDPSGTPAPAQLPAAMAGLGDRSTLIGGARLCGLLASACLGFVLPVLMVVANKTAPAMLGAAALLANLAVLLGGRGPELKRRYGALLGSPTAVAVYLAVAVAVVSFAWTIDPGFTRRGLTEGVPELLFGLAAFAAWPLVSSGRDVTWLLAGIAVAGGLILFEQRTGMPLHALLKERGEAWDLKRSAIPPALLLWPALAFCIRRQRWFLATLLVAAAAVGIVASHSGAPGFALLIAALVYLLGRVVPGVAIGLVACGFVVLITASPWTGTLANRFLPTRVEEALRDEHASHRVKIWTAFEERLHDRPLLGHGFDSSFKISTAPRPDGRAPGEDNDQMVDNHPHNVFLQIWVELGLLGAVTAAAILAFVLRRLTERPRFEMAPRLALLVTVAGIGLVGLSAWQPWWIASIVAALLWFGRVESTTRP